MEFYIGSIVSCGFNIVMVEFVVIVVVEIIGVVGFIWFYGYVVRYVFWIFICIDVFYIWLYYFFGLFKGVNRGVIGIVVYIVDCMAFCCEQVKVWVIFVGNCIIGIYKCMGMGVDVIVYLAVKQEVKVDVFKVQSIIDIDMGIWLERFGRYFFFCEQWQFVFVNNLAIILIVFYLLEIKAIKLAE